MNTAIVNKDTGELATQEQLRAEISTFSWFVSNYKDILTRRKIIKEVVQHLMEKDIHYGKIPGTKKDTLLKAGGEMLSNTFNLGVTPKFEERDDGDSYSVKMEVELFYIPTGTKLGNGVGIASTMEDKYNWRAAVCEEEFDATPENRRRIKWYKNKDEGSKAYSIKQIRTNYHDVKNTIAKMGKKRGMIDAVLTVLGISDIFTQDVEDMLDIPGAISPEDKATNKGPDSKNVKIDANGKVEWIEQPKLIKTDWLRSDPQKNRLLAIGKNTANMKKEDVYGWMEMLWKIKSTKDLSRDCYNYLCDYFLPNFNNLPGEALAGLINKHRQATGQQTLDVTNKSASTTENAGLTKEEIIARGEKAAAEL